MAREKRVFPTSEVPHLWAHKSKAEARNPQGNLFFEGDVIFSYRTSYPIASHVTNSRGECAVLFRSGKAYSVTTAGHMSAVRCSIPSSVPVFEVPNVKAKWDYAPEGVDHPTNIAAYVQDSKEALEAARNARAYGISTLDTAFGYRNRCEEYCEFFDVPFPASSFDFLPSGEALETLRAKLSERESRATAKRNAKREAERKAWEERSRIEALELEEQLALWKAGNPNARLGWSAPMALRIVGNVVETSRGARVPVSHAKLALRLVRHTVTTGREYKRTVEPFKIGAYAVDKITTDGTLHAGCHVIPLSAIEEIAPLLEAQQ
jgi:hypothetical protein